MLLRNFFYIFMCVYLKILNILCKEEGNTLAFAIDDTLSMWNDIDQVKVEAKDIMKTVLTEKSSEIKDFVLVTINDPSVVLRTKTSSAQTFLNHLNSIHIHNYGNSDCAEMSLTGIETALMASRPGSYLYVFTDASAKDYHKVDLIKSLSIKKQTQVVFVLTGSCGHPNDRKYTVYWDIAAASSGQVFEVHKKDVHWVLQFIKMLLKGKNSVLTTISVPPSRTYTSVKFTIDEKADYALVSVSGKNVHLKISTIDYLWGSEPENERVMWNEDGKVVKLINPKPGSYYAWVKGRSTVSVIVYARTDFTFVHGFSILEPKSMKDTSKQPIAGRKQHLSIKVTDPDHSVHIKSVQILDMKEHVIMELPLRKTDDNFYITDAFVSPTQMFKIAVKGQIKRTLEPIKRLSRTAVVPIIKVETPETAPEVVIREGVKLDIDFGARVTLTCKVTAHPPPTIEWFTTGGVSIPSDSSEIEKPKYISYLKLENIKSNETYVCKALNKLGTATSKTDVGVRPAFTTLSIPTAKTTAKYGEDVKIQCNVKSYLPMKIKWFRSGKELSNSGVHSISTDGSKLTLKSVDLRMRGKYTCEASLNSDPTVKQTHETEVIIPGLANPVIKPTNTKIQVTKRDKIELNCKTVGGYPKPHVQWFKKNGKKYDMLHETSEVLTKPRASFTDAGQYKCVAENVIGTDSVKFEVILSSPPEMDVGETRRTYPYDSNVQLSCKVESQPPLSIVWMDENGTVLQNKVTQISEYEYGNQLILPHVKKSASYECVATNNIGHVAKTVDFEVPSPFNVQEHLDKNIGISYGTEGTLRCNIKSLHPMKIQWYQQKSGVKSSRKVIHSSDKDSISADGTELKIKSMDLNMGGKYTCEASLVSDPKENINFSTDVKVVGTSAPEITYSNTILNGKQLKAICRVKGIPKPTISWQFKQKGSEEFTAISGSEEELSILDLKLRDSGVYKCIAKNELGQTQRDLDVVVKERPIITNEENNYFGIEGDLVLQILCNVTGFPEPTIVWKEGHKTKAIGNDSKYVVKGNVLQIKNPTTKDTSNFICEAENKLGTARKTFYAEVTDTFQNDNNYYGKTHNIYVKQGEKVTIDCGIVNSETLSVRWYRNGQKTDQTGRAYVIERATVSDDGNYTCRVNTNKGSQSENHALDVGMSPTFNNEGPSPQTINWKKDEVLDCTENSKPTAKIEWLYNGKKVERLNNLALIPVTDWGKYTCEVSNVHGSIHRTFNVITSGCYIRTNMGTQNMPLISDVYTPTWPYSISNSDITLKQHEKIKLSCSTHPKSPNAFKMLPTQVQIIAHCHTEDKFIIDGKTYKYKELQCEKKVESSVLSTSEQCSGPHSEMIQVGFAVNGFLDAYQVCFDKSRNLALYASAPVTLARPGNGIDPSAFTWRPAPGLGDGKPTGGFTCGESKTCCYAKGQLLNANELAFGPAQIASFKENLNSVAVWNPCSDSNRTSWQSFEEDLKVTSHNYQSWSSWTGASDYVSKNGGFVPRYLWKVLSYDGDSSVMVYVNDGAPVTSDIRCTDLCETMLETADKFLYCCSLDEFSEAFGIPSDSFNRFQYPILKPDGKTTLVIPKEV